MRGRFTALVLAFVCAFQTAARACSCADERPVEEALEAAAAVFTGKVVQLTLVQKDGSYMVACVFETRSSFKAKSQGSKTTVITHSEDSACGFSFKIGEDYLVYAYEDEGELHTNICMRTKALVEGIKERDGSYRTDDSGKKEAAQLSALVASKAK